MSVIWLLQLFTDHLRLFVLLTGNSNRHFNPSSKWTRTLYRPQCIFYVPAGDGCDSGFLAEHYGATIHFLPFQALKYGYHQAKMTILVFWTYYATAAVQPNLSFTIFSQNLNPLISTFDLVIGMRLHSLILAAGLGVPVSCRVRS